MDRCILSVFKLYGNSCLYAKGTVGFHVKVAVSSIEIYEIKNTVKLNC